jgi:hypothetical protein
LSTQSTAREILSETAERRAPPRLTSLGWALRRTALLLLMLFVMVFVLGWLFYAGIDPDEASAGPSAPAAPVAADK